MAMIARSDEYGDCPQFPENSSSDKRRIHQINDGHFLKINFKPRKESGNEIL